MKKLLCTAAVLIFALTSCAKQGKYGDLKDYLEGMIKAQKQYLSDLKKAPDGRSIAKVLEDYNAKMNTEAERAREFEVRYPELAESDRVPAELQKEYSELEEVSKEIVTESMKIMQKYMTDPDVIKAIGGMAPEK